MQRRNYLLDKLLPLDCTQCQGPHDCAYQVANIYHLATRAGNRRHFEPHDHKGPCVPMDDVEDLLGEEQFSFTRP